MKQHFTADMQRPANDVTPRPRCAEPARCERLGDQKRLRVLTYTTLFPNSVQPLWGHFVWERMRHLLDTIDLTVVAPVPYFPPLNVHRRWYTFARVPRDECHDGVRVYHPRYLVVPRLGMVTHGLAMLLGSLPLMRQRLRQGRFDLIDAHYVYPDGLAAVLLGSQLGIPVVVSARGTDITLFPRFAAVRPMIRFVLQRSAALIAVSQSLKTGMVQLGCPPDKVTVIGNGVDANKFTCQPRGVMRRQLALPLEGPLLVSVGHLTERKGFHVLIDAVGRLRTRHPNLLLVVVGDGDWRPHLEQRIQARRLGNHVKLVGARPHAELFQWYSAADLFCLASSREGWPNVLLEAMACGCPVIATAVSGIPEIVVNSRLGTLVDRTPEAFSRAIDDALQRTWDETAIVAHARAHSWDRVARRLLEVYQTVLTPQPAEPERAM